MPHPCHQLNTVWRPRDDIWKLGSDLLMIIWSSVIGGNNIWWTKVRTDSALACCKHSHTWCSGSTSSQHHQQTTTHTKHIKFQKICQLMYIYITRLHYDRISPYVQTTMFRNDIKLNLPGRLASGKFYNQNGDLHQCLWHQGQLDHPYGGLCEYMLTKRPKTKNATKCYGVFLTILLNTTA